MPRHDRRRTERFDHLLQNLDGAGHRSLHEERRAAVEQQIAAVEHLAVRQPDDRVVGGVRRHADVPDVGVQSVHPYGHRVGVGEKGWLQDDLAPVDLGPERGRFRFPPIEDAGAGGLVSDDRGTGEQEVPEGMVTVVMGVDDRPNRLRCDRSDRVQVGTGATDGRAGVDADHYALADKKACVVDPPSPVRLDVSEDAVVDLVQLGRGRVVTSWWMVLMSLSGVVRRCHR
jgi:hypothetical protein